MRVHLVTNAYRPDAILAARETAEWLKQRGAFVGVDRDASGQIDLPVVDRDEFGNADLVIAYGGDGTLIRAAHLAAERGTPVLGVYYGRFGFVTQCLGDDVFGYLEAFFAGKLVLDQRLMLNAELRRGGHVVTQLLALNEVSVQRDIATRMVTIRILVDGQPLTRYPADGVIVSTPTGSTAYNLSVGGPILDPQVAALVLTPIAPHTLAARSLVLRPDAIIDLQVESFGDAVISADGQTRLHLLKGDEVRVTRSEKVTNLVSVNPADFLSKLSSRLLATGDSMGADL